MRRSRLANRRSGMMVLCVACISFATKNPSSAMPVASAATLSGSAGGGRADDPRTVMTLEACTARSSQGRLYGRRRHVRMSRKPRPRPCRASRWCRRSAGSAPPTCRRHRQQADRGVDRGRQDPRSPRRAGKGAADGAAGARLCGCAQEGACGLRAGDRAGGHKGPLKRAALAVSHGMTPTRKRVDSRKNTRRRRSRGRRSNVGRGRNYFTHSLSGTAGRLGQVIIPL